jgi:hypothetical protein
MGYLRTTQYKSTNTEETDNMSVLTNCCRNLWWRLKNSEYWPQSLLFKSRVYHSHTQHCKSADCTNKTRLKILHVFQTQGTTQHTTAYSESRERRTMSRIWHREERNTVAHTDSTFLLKGTRLTFSNSAGTILQNGEQVHLSFNTGLLTLFRIN